MKSALFWTVSLAVLTACTQDQLTHQLTVAGGKGSGEYQLGETAAVEADPAPEGWGFVYWEGDTLFLESPADPVTSLVMPFQDVTVKSVYKEIPTYVLTVVTGSGSGKYPEGPRVKIAVVEDDDEKVFDRWIGDVQYLQDSTTEETFVSMPAKAVRVEAKLKEDRSNVSYAERIAPLFRSRCATAGCHVPGYETPDLTNYEEIKKNAPIIRSQVVSGLMPLDSKLSPVEIELIAGWIDAGAKNN